MAIVSEEWERGQLVRATEVTATTVTVRDAAGAVVSTRAATPLEQAAVQAHDATTNGQTIRTAVRNAITANRTYLALPAPTNAQNTAQLRALTQQIIRIERLLGEQLDGTD